MDKQCRFERRFSIISSAMEENHCFVVVKDADEGFRLFSELRDSLYLEPLNCSRKAKFVVDNQNYSNCAVLEVAVAEEKQQSLVIIPLEYMVSAEVVHILQQFHDGRK